MSAAPVSLGRLWALMLTVFVDMVGLLMVIPLLPFYAKRLGASPFLIGLMVSIFAVAQLAISPYWGRMSDRRGRRPALMAGITIATFAYALFALACSDWAMHHFGSEQLIALFFLSRFVQGAGGATTGVVQAYVGDAIVAEERAKALGWITAATSAGVVIGPALGSLAALGGPAIPGLLAVALCIVNLGFVRGWLPESTSAESQQRAGREPGSALSRRMVEVLRHPRRPVARLIWVYAIGMMAFMAMNSILALFLQARFGFTEKTFGWVYTFVGVISLVMRSLVLGPCVRKFGERGVMRLGLAGLAAGFALQALAPTIPTFAAAIVLIPVGTALLFPATTSLVSRYAEPHELGATMGVQQAYGGMSRLIGPMWAGASFEKLGVGAPFWISAGLALGTLGFALGLQPPPRPRTLEVPSPTPAPASARS
ncbi:MAG: MFS transporter [Thermoanaerobaculia bacterium]